MQTGKTVNRCRSCQDKQRQHRDDVDIYVRFYTLETKEAWPTTKCYQSIEPKQSIRQAEWQTKAKGLNALRRFLSSTLLHSPLIHLHTHECACWRGGPSICLKTFWWKTMAVIDVANNHWSIIKSINRTTSIPVAQEKRHAVMLTGIVVVDGEIRGMGCHGFGRIILCCRETKRNAATFTIREAVGVHVTRIW